MKLSQAIGTPAFRVRFFVMNADRVVEVAIRAAKNLLWENLPPTHNLLPP
jgi:hypothetical protein